MHIRDLLTQDQLNNFDESIALELIQKIEEGNIQDLSCKQAGVRAETIVLIAATLANCSNLHTVDMNNNLSSADAIKIANFFAYKNNPITLGIEGKHRGPILETISNDNTQMHQSFEQAMNDTFNNTPPGLLGLMEGYADFSIEFIE